MTCNLRHPVGLRHPVSRASAAPLTEELRYISELRPSGFWMQHMGFYVQMHSYGISGTPAFSSLSTISSFLVSAPLFVSFPRQYTYFLQIHIFVYNSCTRMCIRMYVCVCVGVCPNNWCSGKHWALEISQYQLDYNFSNLLRHFFWTHSACLGGILP